ncbi:MAG TPA: metallopeptidase TldD-related protein [Polyangia bacterium]
MIARRWSAVVVLLMTGAAGADAGADSLAKPADAPGVTALRVNPASVRKAMEDELARSMKDLHMGDDEPHPYFIAYTISDMDQATTSATLGAVTAAHAYRGRLLRTEIRVGDANFDNTNFEGGANVEAIPIEDDYAALRREIWLRSDESYKNAVETLARKRSAAAGQASADEDDGVGDFSPQTAAHVEVPFTASTADPGELRETVRKLSLILASFPEIYGSHVTGTNAIVRRRLATSEGSWVDDNQRTLRIDVVADTQADDGMKLRSFVPFSAVDMAGLPPFAEMEKAVRAMAKELVAARQAPIATSGAGAVLFEGPAAAQIVKILLGDQLGGTPPPKTASAGSDDGGQQSVLAGKLGQRVAAPILSLVDDPLLAAAPGKAAVFGSYRVDDEGVAAQRVSLIEKGVLKSLLMSRTPRKEITRSNGHGRAPRFAGVRAHVGTLVLTGAKGQKRAEMIAALDKIAKGGGVTTYIVRLLDDGSIPGGDADDLTALFSFGGGSHGPPPIRPLIVYRVAHGKETLVRGVTLENLLPRSFKEIAATGNEPVVYNYQDGGGGFSGVPSTIIAPALLFPDVDIRRQPGKHRKPPVYPSPLAQPSSQSSASRQ